MMAQSASISQIYNSTNRLQGAALQCSTEKGTVQHKDIKKDKKEEIIENNSVTNMSFHVCGGVLFLHICLLKVGFSFTAIYSANAC